MPGDFDQTLGQKERSPWKPVFWHLLAIILKTAGTPHKSLTQSHIFQSAPKRRVLRGLDVCCLGVSTMCSIQNTPGSILDPFTWIHPSAQLFVLLADCLAKEINWTLWYLQLKTGTFCNSKWMSPLGHWGFFLSFPTFVAFRVPSAMWGICGSGLMSKRLWPTLLHQPDLEPMNCPHSKGRTSSHFNESWKEHLQIPIISCNYWCFSVSNMTLVETHVGSLPYWHRACEQ